MKITVHDSWYVSSANCLCHMTFYSLTSDNPLQTKMWSFVSRNINAFPGQSRVFHLCMLFRISKSCLAELVNFFAYSSMWRHTNCPSCQNSVVHPTPWVSPTAVLMVFIRDCFIVMSVHVPDQNLSTQRMVNPSSVVNFEKLSAIIFSFKWCMSWRSR